MCYFSVMCLLEFVLRYACMFCAKADSLLWREFRHTDKQNIFSQSAKTQDCAR